MNKNSLIQKKNSDIYIEEDPELTFDNLSDNVDLDKKMLDDYTYPSPTQEDFQNAIYVKRDFYMHTIPEREPYKSEQDKREKRNAICSREFKLTETQVLLSNFINPNTPYTGLLIYHGTGIGKTPTAIAIAENFKPMVEKYQTRIHVLVPGPLHKQNFINQILKSTGETYYRMFYDKTVVISENDKLKIKKNAITVINQYYRIISNRSFHKKVLGEKIRDKVMSGNKMTNLKRKDETGEYERDFSVDRIYNLDNTLLIIDEAHNLTDNDYGRSVKKIIESSKNLRIILLSATPFINFADECIELINYLRPIDQPMLRNKIFTTQRDHLMEFKEGGKDYLKKMVRGYVSYLRGMDPLTFAERVDVGEIPPGLTFVKVTRCFMLPFQLKMYNEAVETSENDYLGRHANDVANFIFAGISKDKNEKGIVGFHGIDGIKNIRIQLENNAEALTKKIAETVLAEYKITDTSNLLYLSPDNKKIISGDIFNEKYLKHFSIKFYTALQNINSAVVEKRGAGLIFVYSNLVKNGAEIFQEVLLNNGYLEYKENAQYQIKNSTRCYYCENAFGTHSQQKHEFFPATFVTITGQSDDNEMQQIPEEKYNLLNNVFNNNENKHGKKIKIVIGTKVMNEGLTLNNIKEIHVLDVHFNLGKLDQVIGRGIRFCTHNSLITDDYLEPKVEIYKYVVSMKDKLTTDEDLYRKAESKYLLIKETERVFQEEAIDCPLNMNGNIFQEEIERYKNCGSKDKPCPPQCGYMPCKYKCGDKLLNAKYYDKDREIYKKVEKADIDYSTYNKTLANQEISYVKTKIKELYAINSVYTLNDILKYVKKSYPVDKKELFDNFYVYQALNDMIPITTNDFNTFSDTILDKFNRNGYLIYRNKYYIFQLANENEDLPMHYRNSFYLPIINQLSINDYIKNSDKLKEYDSLQQDDTSETKITSVVAYDFDSTQDYYDSRDEFEYVGIVDYVLRKDKNKNLNDYVDEFKIRQKRPKVLTKRRETGLPSFKGSVCHNSKDKKYLIEMCKLIGVNYEDEENRIGICNAIRDKLFDMEKYATGKSKKTYFIVPANHPSIPFPLNLEDRITKITDDIEKETKTKINYKILSTKQKGKFADIKYFTYIIEFSNVPENLIEIYKLYGAIHENKKLIIKVE